MLPLTIGCGVSSSGLRLSSLSDCECVSFVNLHSTSGDVSIGVSLMSIGSCSYWSVVLSPSSATILPANPALDNIIIILCSGGASVLMRRQGLDPGRRALFELSCMTQWRLLPSPAGQIPLFPGFSCLFLCSCFGQHGGLCLGAFPLSEASRL